MLTLTSTPRFSYFGCLGGAAYFFSSSTGAYNAMGFAYAAGYAELIALFSFDF